MLFSVLRDILSTHQPDVVITTYPLYQAPLATLKALSRRGTPFLTVVTDLATRPPAVVQRERGVVPRAHAGRGSRRRSKAGCSRDRVEITGLPVNPRLGRPVDKAALRAKLGWSSDRGRWRCSRAANG